MSAGPERDPVFAGFLRRQRREGEALARSSDLLELVPIGDAQAPDRYLARFRCRGLVRPAGGEVAVAEGFEVGIWFPLDYLRRADPFQVLTWLGPRDVFHPNVSAQLPLLCIGRLVPGTPLVDLLYQCFEIVTWRKVTMREDDALNAAACAWARQHRQRWPVDGRPLKRRRLELRVETSAGGAA
ncbi:MAG TPA: hypothetical protein VMT16_14390 [Thermoanaerobaculia bacterium]|nr:hypothetical protein [Thermoanaerobaculia bacterium]